MYAFRRPRIFAIPIVVALAGCGGSDGGGSMGPQTVATVTVTPATGTLKSIGETLQLSASAKDNSGDVVTGASIAWSSSIDAVATVSSTGQVTAVGNGTSEISATADGVKGTAQITVAQEVSTVTVNPAALQIETGSTGQLSAGAADANGNAVNNGSITWTSSDETVATVDATGLVSAVAEGTATITAAAGAGSGTAEVTVVPPPPFTPTQDTTVSGNITVSNVSIPQGVTVTLGGDVTLTASAPVVIAGALTGDCTSATLSGLGDVTVSGSVTTTCSAASPGDELPVLTILSAGTLTLDGATITSGGDLVAGNAGTAVAVVSPFGGPAAVGGQGACEVGGGASLVGGTGAASTTPGVAGQRGGDVAITCSGSPTLGDLSVRGGDGGNGASQEVTGGLATAVGAVGGRGGDVSITATGDHISATANISLTVGDGGLGGNAVAKSQDPAVKATAMGGGGGDAGTLTVNVPLMGGGSVTVQMGFGGLGGYGRADAANGTETHFDGGDAEGHGGKGGDAPAMTPEAFSSSSALFTTSPPQGGDGGFGAGEFGSGGDGTANHRVGGDAGSLTAFGGAGGSVVDAAGKPGLGGEMDVVLQHGGNGFNGCLDLTAGGNGGMGGYVSGGSGLGGFFANGTNGQPGDVIYGQVGVGGNGGDGLTPGSGGTAGVNDTQEAGNVVGLASSFKQGTDGTGCTIATAVSISVTSDPNGHEPFIMYSTISSVTLSPHADGSITLTSTNSRWVTLNGSLSGDDFTASGTGTVAGFSGIPVSITGTLTRDTDGNVTGFDGTITIDGTNLPANSDGQHNDVTYSISGTVASS